MSNPVGNEIVYALGIAANGQPAATTEPFTTLQLANAAKQVAIITAEDDIVSTTTLVAVPGLSVPLVAGGTYNFSANLPMTSDATGGVKLAVAGASNLSATSIASTYRLFSAVASATGNGAGLGSSFGTTLGIILAEISGTIVVNTAGNLVVQAAQNAATTVTTALLVNGSLTVSRIS